MPRKFGVEIECDFPSGEDGLGDLLFEGHEKKLYGPWYNTIVEDGSCAEVRIGPLSGVAGLNELVAVMDHIRDNGGSTTAEDGLHVHFDAPEFYGGKYTGYYKYHGSKPNDLADVLIESWFNNQELIHELVPEYRHDHWACVGWAPHQVETFKKTKEPGRHEIHMATQHKTIEIRLLQGTLDTDLATSWVRFGMAFINSMAKRTEPLPKKKSVEALLKTIRTPLKAQEVLTTYDKSAYQGESCDYDDYYDPW